MKNNSDTERGLRVKNTNDSPLIPPEAQTPQGKVHNLDVQDAEVSFDITVDFRPSKKEE